MATPTSPSSSVRTRNLLALGAGLVLLGLLVVFAVVLPKVDGEGSGAAGALPDSIAGGWTALEDAPGPDGADSAQFEAQQKQALAYVNQVLGSVYDEQTQFRAYIDRDRTAIVTATLFDAPGGAFAPANGVADAEQLELDKAPVELTRNGDAVCITNYQSAPATGAGDAEPADATPLSVSCQTSRGEQTVQIGSTQMSVDDTVTLLDDLASGI